MLITPQTLPRASSVLSTEIQSPRRLVLAIVGDSNAAGFSAALENATGFRVGLQRLLREAGIWFRMVGLHSFGYLNGTGTTYGKYPTVDAYHDAYECVIGDTRNDGFSGRLISYTHTVTSIDTGTGTIFAAGHRLLDNSPVVLESTGALPTVTGAFDSVEGTVLAFARNVVAGVSYQLARYEGGPALAIPDAGSGTITGGEGIGDIFPALASSWDETPTDIILMGGTNDITALIQDGTPSPLAVLQARAIQYFANVQAAVPNARKYVPPVLPITSGITGFAEMNDLRNQYNAWLATYVQRLGRTWSYLAELADAVSAAQMSSDGIHPHAAGFEIYAKGLARAIITGSGNAHPDEIFPREFVRRPPRACVEFRATTDKGNIPAQSILNPAGLSGFAAISFMPFELKSGLNAILQNEASYNNGLLIGATNNQLRGYIHSAGPAIPAGLYTAVLKLFRWHRLFYFWDFAKQEVALFCNGNMVQRAFTSWTAITPSTGWYIGGNGLNSAPGLYSEFMTGVGDFDIEDALRMAQRDYFLGEDPTGTTAKYHLDDGSGTTLTSENEGATNGTLSVTTGGWVGSGRYLRPWSVGYVKPRFDSRIGSVTAAYTPTYWESVPCDPSAGGFTITLPTATGHDGERIRAFNTTSSTNPIAFNGAVTAASIAAAYGAMEFEARNGIWYPTAT